MFGLWELEDNENDKIVFHTSAAAPYPLIRIWNDGDGTVEFHAGAQPIVELRPGQQTVARVEQVKMVRKAGVTGRLLGRFEID